MELRRYWEIVLRYKVLIIALVLCASVGALAATYIITDKYIASSLVLVQPMDTRRFSDPPMGIGEKQVLGFPLGGSQIKVFNRSYAEIIQSRAIAKQIVDELHLDQIPEPTGENIFKRAWKGLKSTIKLCFNVTWVLLRHGRLEKVDPYENLIDAVKNSISASEIRDTYLVNITVKSSDPNLAAVIANTAAKVFVRYWQKEYMKETVDDLSSLEAQLKASDMELTAMFDAVDEYKEKEGIMDLGLEITHKISFLTHFEARLREIEADIQEVFQERNDIRRQMESREEMAMATTKIQENPVAVGLKGILVEHEIRMAGLRKRFTPTHPEVLSLQAMIEETERRLAAEAARTVADETSTYNPVYVELEQKLVVLNAKLPALEAKRDDYKLTMEKYQQELLALRDKEKKLDALERKIKTLKDVNAEFVFEVKDFHVLSTKKPEEIRLVSSATPPVYPSGPIKLYYVGAAAAVSLIIGIALAFFFEYLNNRIRTIEEAELNLSLPVLATIPRIKKLADAEFPEILISGARPDSL